MTNLEYHKDELKRYLKDESDLRHFRYWETRGHDNFIDWLLEEHKEHIKLTKFEYDLLESYINKGYYFYNFSELKEMRNKGYFKGIKDTSMMLREILNNCEVVD